MARSGRQDQGFSPAAINQRYRQVRGELRTAFADYLYSTAHFRNIEEARTENLSEEELTRLFEETTNRVTQYDELHENELRDLGASLHGKLNRAQHPGISKHEILRRMVVEVGEEDSGGRLLDAYIVCNIAATNPQFIAENPLLLMPVMSRLQAGLTGQNFIGCFKAAKAICNAVYQERENISAGLNQAVTDARTAVSRAQTGNARAVAEGQLSAAERNRTEVLALLDRVSGYRQALDRDFTPGEVPDLNAIDRAQDDILHTQEGRWKSIFYGLTTFFKVAGIISLVLMVVSIGLSAAGVSFTVGLLSVSAAELVAVFAIGAAGCAVLWGATSFVQFLTAHVAPLFVSAGNAVVKGGRGMGGWLIDRIPNRDPAPQQPNPAPPPQQPLQPQSQPQAQQPLQPQSQSQVQVQPQPQPQPQVQVQQPLQPQSQPAVPSTTTTSILPPSQQSTWVQTISNQPTGGMGRGVGNPTSSSLLPGGGRGGPTTTNTNTNT